AKSVRKGDIVCFLKEALKLIIIRLYGDYFAVVLIAATPLNDSKSFRLLKLFKSIVHFPRDFLLVWDWENPLENS
ncbi:hypothetical protein BKA65DRAFT_414002, partial [Rhexocercosporidium sp. MPI-PUGE-AT-0058]